MAYGHKNMEGEYNEYVVHTAFMLWWEICNRDCADVAEKLRTDPVYRELAGLEDGARSPSRDTIKRWEREKFWELNAIDKMRQGAPWRIQAAATRMAYAAEQASEVIVEMLTTTRELKASDKIRGENAWKLLQSTVGDSVVQLARPAVAKSVDMGKLETMEEIAAAERELTAGSE